MTPVEILIERECPFKKKGSNQRGCQRCGRFKKDPVHIGAPPSLRMFGSGAQQSYQTQKHIWQDLLQARLRAAGLQPAGRFVVEAEACFPDQTRRDQGNFRFLLEKALGDALTAGGWLEDDDWTRYEFGQLAYRYEKGRSYTRLVLFPAPVAVERAAAGVPPRHIRPGYAPGASSCRPRVN